MDTNYDFKVKLEYKHSSPQKVLLTAAAYIDALAEVDELLLKTIAPDIKCSYQFAKIESGSLVAFLVSVLQDTSDEELKKGNFKAVVGAFLYKAKYAILKHFEQHNGVGSRNDLMELCNSVHMLALQSKVQPMQAYSKMPLLDLGNAAKKVSDAVQSLGEGESIAFQAYTSSPAVLNNGFMVTQDDIDNLLVERSIPTPCTRLLKVRKPDFLGKSKWEFRYNGQNIAASINDTQWLAQFQNGKEEFRPGVSLEAECLIVTKYGYDNEVVSEECTIERVIDVRQPMEQASMI